MRIIKTLKKMGLGFGASALLVLPTPSVVYAAADTELHNAIYAGVAYLADQQQADGSIAGNGGESDWAAIALAAADQNIANFAYAGEFSLLDFLQADIPSETTPVTGIERKILGIIASGGDVSLFGGVDYTSLLREAHNNGQIGDPTLLNDDIFGILAIAAIGDETLTPIAQDALNYLIEHQSSEGGFSYTTDTCDWCGVDSNDTAAAIVSFAAAKELGLMHKDLDGVLDNAVAYLLSTQGSDGGFMYDTYAGVSDGSSTAWSLIALNTIGSSVNEQRLPAQNWLLNNQNDDGGFSYGAYGFTASDTYTTAHALIALLGTNWILNPAPILLPAAEDDTDDSGTPTEEPDTAYAPVQQQPQITQLPSEISPLPTVATTSAPQNEVESAEPTEQSVQTQDESVLSESDEVTEELISAEPEESATSSLSRIIGTTLIAVALVGFSVYALRVRRANTTR